MFTLNNEYYNFSKYTIIIVLNTTCYVADCCIIPNVGNHLTSAAFHVLFACYSDSRISRTSR